MANKLIKLYTTLKAHFGHEDAEAIVEGFQEIVEAGNDALRKDFKKDLVEVRVEIKEVRAELKQDIAALKTELVEKISLVSSSNLKWVAVQTLVIIGAVLGIVWGVVSIILKK